MAEKVKLSKDGATIDFVQSEVMPTSLKKLRQSPEIEGFYRFIFENDLQNEAYQIMDALIIARKAKRSQARKDAKELTKAAAAPSEKPMGKPTPTATAKTPIAAKAVVVEKSGAAKAEAKQRAKATPKAKDQAVSKTKAKDQAKVKGHAKPQGKAHMPTKVPEKKGSKPDPKVKAKKQKVNRRG